MDMENGNSDIKDNSNNINTSISNSDNVNIYTSQNHHLTKQGLNNLTYQVSCFDILNIAINIVSPNERIIILFVYLIYFSLIILCIYIYLYL